jgi:hypothetical protein
MKSQVCSRAEDIHDIREVKRAKLTRIIWRGIENIPPQVHLSATLLMEIKLFVHRIIPVPP